MTTHDQTPAADPPPGDNPPRGDDPAGDFPQPSLLEILERAGTAGEALEVLAAACPGTPHAEILAALDEHAAVERLSAVLAELVRRLDEGGGQASSDRQGPNQPPLLAKS